MEKDYSLLAISVCKSREERMREKDNSSSSATVLAKKVAKKIASLLRSRSRYSRRKSTLVFDFAADPNCESDSQCYEPQQQQQQHFRAVHSSPSSRRHL